jgi:hypothetical protein
VLAGSATTTATLRNCIVWGNQLAFLGSDLLMLGMTAQLDTSTVGAFTGSWTGAGNQNLDPLFVDLANGDVHLTALSPCRHAGVVVAGLPPFDIDGDARMIGPGIDMGADEFEALPGSREDLVMQLSVNGSFAASVLTTPAVAGDVLSVSVTSPTGTMSDAFAVLLVEPWVPPFNPQGPPIFPFLHLPLGSSWLSVFPAGAGAIGATFSSPLPPGLAGLSFRLQAIALTTAAKNGLFAAAAARDLVL